MPSGASGKARIVLDSLPAIKRAMAPLRLRRACGLLSAVAAGTTADGQRSDRGAPLSADYHVSGSSRDQTSLLRGWAWPPATQILSWNT